MTNKHTTNRIFSNPADIKAEIKRISAGGAGPVFAHFKKAIEDKELAPFMELTRTYDPVEGSTIHGMKDIRTGDSIKYPGFDKLKSRVLH